VRYIITKDALREGWDCPFAYVLAILSKTTANTALTQMIGRILRQPHAQLTHVQLLDECYVFTFDQDVSAAVNGVRKGLEEEGMADLVSSIKGLNGSGSLAAVTRRETIKRRKAFADIPPIFLPRVLHRDVEAGDFRSLDYDRDILGELQWDNFRFLNADTMDLEVRDRLTRTIARIDIDKAKDTGQVDLDLKQEQISDVPEEGLDVPFLVRQLLDVIPNPWQGMRILDETLHILRARGVSESRIYANRLDLLQVMKIDLSQQVRQAAEALFRQKLEMGDISLRLVASNDPGLNWKLSDILEIDVSDEDRILYKNNGNPLERSLFEKVYQREFDSLEKDTAWYLDGAQCVYWWHRIAVHQGSYGLQGWQRQRVYPDFLACVHETENGKFRFSVLETKGEHLKGNDDTEYKRKLFQLLTENAKSAIRAGRLELQDGSINVSYTMLLQDNWKQELAMSNIK
jgi:type III restriction enzyme